jgi:hypothetical protein
MRGDLGLLGRFARDGHEITGQTHGFDILERGVESWDSTDGIGFAGPNEPNAGEMTSAARPSLAVAEGGGAAAFTFS